MIPKKLRKYRDNTPPTTQLERIRAHYVKDKNLSSNDAETLEKMQTARQYMLTSLSRVEALNKLCEHFGIKQRRAYQIVALTEEFFGTSDAISKDFLRVSIHEALVKIHNKAMEAGDLQAAQNALDTITRIHALNRPDVLQLDTSTLELPMFQIQVVAAKKDKSEDTTYIEIPSEEE